MEKTSSDTIKWLKITQGLTKGINILNTIDDTKFEQFLKRIAGKIKEQNHEIFTEEEKQKLEKIFHLDDSNLDLAIKTVIYLLKRMLKYVFKPTCLKKSLISISLQPEKIDAFIKIWSIETKELFDGLEDEEISKCGNELNVSWKLNAEISSHYKKKVKIPKAYLSLSTNNNENELELVHSELYSMFLQFEAIQTELDLLI